MSDKKPTKAEREAAECAQAIAEMPPADRRIAERLHQVITEAAPELAPRTWYKQPAYAKDGKVVVFMRGAAIDGERYLTLGFSGDAHIDDGTMWPTAFAVTDVTEADARRITALVRSAVG